ncbi:hypothetical protein D5S17_22890 [Pseudonocardiaceae bacterium YIM PH 21723]|nr:hypothetical protein D5S17_22890 [Pseudonocardiaceae bacterium YIM PH 21723]
MRERFPLINLVEGRLGTMVAENLEPRVAAVEVKLGELTEEVKEVKLIATGARDEAKLARQEIKDFRQATTTTLNAMQENISELHGRMGSLEGRVGSLETKVDQGFMTMRAKFDQLAAGQAELGGLLNVLINQGKKQPE